MFWDSGEELKLSYLSPYLESLAPNFTSGVNFAVSGATTLPQFVPFALDIQVRQFIHFKNRSLELQSLGMYVVLVSGFGCSWIRSNKKMGLNSFE